MQRIGLWTVLFLILLRLAIGWHFLFEGLNKVKSHYVGETTSSRPFSSGGYFREANGPLGPVFRAIIGDPDQEALTRLVPKPQNAASDPASDKPGSRMPPGLLAAWWGYVHALEAHYGLDKAQRDDLYTRVEQQQSRVVDWLEGRGSPPPTKEITLTYPSGEVKRDMTPPERVAAYKARLDEVQQAVGTNWMFLKDVDGARIRKAKSEAAELRTSLLKDLDDFTADLKKAADAVPTAEQKARGPVPPVDANLALTRLDFATRWGLTILGACLLLGLFTRTSCLLAAGFLLTTYLAVPSWHWLPVVGPTEGNYVYVNKNVVELLALLALATTRSGRWFGLDAILGWFTDLAFGRKPAPKPAAAPEPAGA